MLHKLRYLLGLVLLVSLMPIQGMSQTTADDKADKRERAHRKHVVKKAVHKVRHAGSRVYHAPANAVRKAKAKHAAHEKAEGETK